MSFKNFYPRPPRGGRHDTIGGQNVYTIISIHALREEGDATGIPSSKVLRDFYPRPPRGGRPRQRQQQTEHGKFLSTPSARRATILSSAPRAVDWISIHALREEGDCPQMPSLCGSAYFYPRPPRGGRPSLAFSLLCNREISIHALREEGDGCSIDLGHIVDVFLSTPSARRATAECIRTRL